MRDPMDEGDIAQDYQARLNAASLAGHHAKNNVRPRPSSRFCARCEEEIPEGRRTSQPGCTRCVACQSLHERLQGGI